MSDLAYKISVMQAALEGKKIQHKVPNIDGWFDAEASPPNYSWNWARYNYRIAPEPRKPREWTTLIEPESGLTYPDEGGKDDCLVSGGWERVRVREVIEE